MCDRGSYLVNCDFKCTTEIFSFPNNARHARGHPGPLFVHRPDGGSAHQQYGDLRGALRDARRAVSRAPSFVYRMTEISALYASLAMHTEDSYAGVAETFLVMLAMHLPQVFLTPQA